MICYGSVIKYCKDYQKIENYDKAIADKTQTWHCHHRLELAPFSGKNVTANRLIQLGMYYNVQPEALIFLTEKEHRSLHMKGNKIMLGKHHTEETKRKCSENNKGKHHWTEEMRRKRSELNKGNTYAKGCIRSEEARKKISEANKGHTAWNKGKKGLQHFSEDVRKKLSEARKGKHWYTNGAIDKLCTTCPDGFVPGRLHHK